MNVPAMVERGPVQRRNDILRLEAAMLRMPEHQIDIPVTHHFAPGIYAREITIPAGCTLVGKLHRFGHINVISKGRIAVETEHGVRIVTAPCTMQSSPGIKRVGFAIEETVWTTFHANPTDETDPDKLEALLIAPEYAALDEGLKVEADK